MLVIFGALPCMVGKSNLDLVGKTMVMLEGLDMRMGPFHRLETSVSGI